MIRKRRSAAQAEPESRSLRVGSRSLCFDLLRSARRTLALQVHPDGRLVVRAPSRCPLTEIDRFVGSRADWIARKRSEFAARVRPQLEYSHGAQHPYLGDVFRLAVSKGRPRSVVLASQRFEVRVTDPADEAQVRRALEGWYRQRAGGLFRERIAHWHGRMAHLNILLPTLRVRAMRSRWGSCSNRGNVNLNLWLIKLPLECIDYVVVHELCHLREFHHGPAFYALMDEVLPDWRKTRARLSELGQGIL